jgi:hypothetical protein
VESFREFAIEPTSEAICVPEPHTSGGVAIYLIATYRSQSLFADVTKHSRSLFGPFGLLTCPLGPPLFPEAHQSQRKNLRYVPPPPNPDSRIETALPA